MKRVKRIGFAAVGVVIGAATLVIITVQGTGPVFDHLRGLFLIEVERNGEAWYVLPESGQRLYLGRPDEALTRLQAIAESITSQDLERIPVADSALARVAYNAVPSASKSYLGKVVIRGDHKPYDIWYVSPHDGVRYPLQSAYDAFVAMKDHSLGITQSDIVRIPATELLEEREALSFVPINTISTFISPGFAPPTLESTALRELESFIESARVDELLRNSLVGVTVDGFPALVHPQYRRWFFIGTKESSPLEHIDSMLSGGTYYDYSRGDSAVLSMQYSGRIAITSLTTFADNNDAPLVYLVKNGSSLSTLTIGIRAQYAVYPEYDATLFEFVGRDAFFGIGDIYRAGESMLVFRKGSLQKLVGGDSASVAQWETSSGTIVGDARGVFAVDNIGRPYRIIAANPSALSIKRTSNNEVQTVSDARNSYRIDTHNGRIRPQSPVSQSKKKTIAPNIIAQQDGIYFYTSSMKVPLRISTQSAEGFVEWPESKGLLFTDGSQIFFFADAWQSHPQIYALSQIDTATFELLGIGAQGLLVRDKKGVYEVYKESGRVRRAPDVDPDTFRVLYEDNLLIGKDARHVFAGFPLEKVNGVDAASFLIIFTVEGIPFGRDQQGIYYALPADKPSIRRLEGADPRTFSLHAIPIVEPALRTLTYQGNERLVYATDKDWIWFYDGNQNGLLVIRRADPNEKISDEDILNFARTYIHFVR